MAKIIYIDTERIHDLGRALSKIDAEVRDSLQRVIRLYIAAHQEVFDQLSNLAAHMAANAINYQHLVEILEDALDHEAKPEQIKAEIRDTPFSSLAALLPRDRAELYAFITLLLTIAQIVLSTPTAASPPTITPGQVEEIIERVLESRQHPAATQPLSPPNTDAPPSPSCP